MSQGLCYCVGELGSPLSSPRTDTSSSSCVLPQFRFLKKCWQQQNVRGGQPHTCTAEHSRSCIRGLFWGSERIIQLPKACQTAVILYPWQRGKQYSFRGKPTGLEHNPQISVLCESSSLLFATSTSAIAYIILDFKSTQFEIFFLSLSQMEN